MPQDVSKYDLLLKELFTKLIFCLFKLRLVCLKVFPVWGGGIFLGDIGVILHWESHQCKLKNYSHRYGIFKYHNTQVRKYVSPSSIGIFSYWLRILFIHVCGILF
jgi:hypothetical protein